VITSKNLYKLRMYYKSVLFSFVLAIAAIAVPAQADANTIVDIAVSNENFSSLVDAVVSQDLAGVLAGEGPFTVFAPTNDAFEKLPGYATRALSKNPDLLTDILLYHVVPGNLLAADVLSERQLQSVQGEKLWIRSAGDKAFVNISQITATDVVADNGVIHVINRVLIPHSVLQFVIDDARAQIEDIREKIEAKQKAGKWNHR
jgi:uncharacterized surface protein with fasciclin (FAS1) repeats